jgi:alpha-tubulin suppressor-like RCC1 family protein
MEDENNDREGGDNNGDDSVTSNNERKVDELTKLSMKLNHNFIPTVISLVPRPMKWDSKKNSSNSRNRKIVDVACGDHHTVVITDIGEVWAWGLNQVGQCIGTNDGSTNDGSTNDGSTNDGSTNDGSTNDGSTNNKNHDEQLWPRLLMKNGTRVKCGPNTTAVIVKGDK